MNDYHFKIAKIKGEFIWHNHKNTDEAFIIIEGSMRIALNDEIINLSEGELFIVPKGVEHKPFADKECKIMLIELKGTQNTGGKPHSLTAENNQWI